MSDIAERIALLPPEKRALLAARLARSERRVQAHRQIPTRERGVPAPLSYNQRSVWFLDQLYPGNVAYNSPIAVRFSGRLDPEALEWSWNEIIRRHDLLRTVFELRDGDPVQYAKPFRSVRLRRMELSQLPECERMEAAREEAVREAREPFNLASELPWRAKLLCCSEREHVLVVILHHIICDGWSTGVLVRELVAGYEAFLRGETSPLRELPIQYADYVAWQREQLAGPSFQRHLELWRKRLEGVTDVPQLPLDKPRPGEPTFRGARIFTQLSPQLTESLRRIAHSEGATLFMVLLAAFKVLLSRYSGESDIIVGSQVANRERSELEGLIGFFANTLVLRTDLSSDPTFLELLGRVRDTALAAYDSQDVPFKKLVEELKPEKQPNRNPFFDIDFNFRNLPQPIANVPDLNVELLRIDHRTSKFDLSMEIAEIGGGLDVAVEYSTELFDASTPAGLLRSYQTLLEGIVANPKRKISQLSLLTEAERHQILVEWNKTPPPSPGEPSIHELFEEQVKRTPEAVAVIFEDQQLSYQELNGRANRLAHYLIECGVKPESFVGIILERSIDLIIAILATLKSGAAYLPLDSDYPQELLTQILTDAMPTVVLSNARLRRRLPETLNVLELDSQKLDIPLGLAAVENPTNSERAEPLLSDNPAYLIYTSGSTGTPKGVVIEHVALSVYSRTVVAHYELSSTDRVLQFASLSFDAAVEEIFPTLIVGATLVMRGSEIWTSWECRQKIRELGITVINLPTAYWEQLVQDWANEEDDLSTNVRLILVGGEAMRPQGVELWRRTPLRAARLLNTYGPTEATVIATTFELPPTAHFPARVPIGKPLPGRLAYIFDGNLEPVPVGVPGELYLGGKCLARGYLNQPKLTQERFVADPHGVDAEARVYKTGDLARWLPDGNIQFIARSDNQVKIRGFRIEPGEVEVLLRHHAGVRDAVVVAREDEPGQRQLVAYIVSRNGRAPEDLRSFLQGKLPGYMVPQAFVELDALPMTTSGKVDRRALPKPERQLQGYRAPRTPEEEILCGIYADLLSLERVGIDDNFFSLGGHSLLAMQLVSRARSAFGVELALREVFEAPAVAELIGRLPGTRKRSETRQERADELHPLSYAQRSVWFLDQLYPGNVAYNSPIAVRFSGRLDPEALEWSWNEIIRRHDLLRTVFELRDGDPVQYAKPFRSVRLRRMELSQLPECERMEAAREEAVREAREPFNLASELPWRAKLLCCSEREHVLVVILHHIICDGWSTGVLVRELVAGYEAFLRGETSPLRELPIQYADYVAWQREQLAGPSFQRHLELWRKRLEGVTDVPQLPLDKPRPGEPTFRGARIFTQLSPQLTESLRRIAHSEGATLFMVLLAAFKVLLSRYSGESDIIVGCPIANRERRELEGLIGFFANTLVLRTDLSGDPTFVELLARVREATLMAYDCQEVPFEKLVEELRPERQLNRNPFFDISFSFQNLPMPGVNIPDLGVELLRIDNGTSKFDLSVALVETQKGLATTVEYNTELFDASTASRLLGSYRRLLEGITRNPRENISRLPLMSASEREQVVVGWNATAVEYPAERGIHQLFEEQARRSPQAVAVVFGERALSYGELDRRSGELASYLRGLGVGLGGRVALCVEPSVEMIIGLLGILKAGGAYVPIDPNYPEPRMGLMVEDSGAEALLTRQGLVGKFSGQGALKKVCLDGSWEASVERLSGGRTQRVSSAVGSEAVACVLYTSGSTGKPKGVCVPHRGVNRLVVNSDYVRFGAEDVVAQISNCCFDAASFEIWGALLNGSRLVGIEPERVLSAEAFSAELCRHGVTTLLVTTALFNALAHERPTIFSTLRTVLFGGEECDARAVRKVLESGGAPQRLLNLYGPTETTTFATWYEVRAGQQSGTSGRIPIGRPIANTQVYILDRHLDPVPIGVAGEICIGGEGVANGYFNRPALSAERFIASPFGRGQRLYRSGDLGRFLSDGNIEFLGRLDNQVKIRGFRIEPGEIEAAILSHRAVRQAVVVARESAAADPGGSDRQLVAYLVLGKEEKADAVSEELGAWLSRRLPDYMVPAAYVVVEELPLTPNGKIDRQALPAPAPECETKGYRAPRTPEEEILCAIYAELLSLERVGIDENFFSLGGHSLLAMQLVNRVRGTLGVELSVRTVFEAPTVAQLIARLRGARWARASLVRQERPERLPLSFAQQRLWFLDRLEGSSSEYNMREALRLRGELNIDALERAIDALIQRHEILRTHFDEQDGEPYQIIDQELQIPLRLQDLSGLEEDLRQEAIQKALRMEGAEPFNLSQGPLLRIGLLKLGSQDYILYWTCHHIISDGWSAAVFTNELSALYASFKTGESASLAELPAQYVDYALYQRRRMDEGELERLLEYWCPQLGDLPVSEFPSDYPRPSSPNIEGNVQTLLLPESLRRDFRKLSSQENATMAMLLMAAFELLLGRLSGQDNVAVGLPIAGRGSAESEKLIGLFVNTLVLRAKLDGSLTFRQLLAQVRKTSLEAYAHQEMPFEKLVEVLNPERVLNRHPLFEVLFNYLSLSRPTPNLPGLSAERLRPETLRAKFSMTLYVEDAPAGLVLRLVYQIALFSPERIRHVVDQLHSLLRQIAVNPDLPIRAYSLVTEHSRGLLPDPTILLAEPKQVPVPGTFLFNAERGPDQIALRQGEKQWTYQQLATSATNVARLLVAGGVLPGDVVAVSGPRSFGLVSGIMGVLLTRGVLLMLDSSLPSARRDAMLHAASGKHWLAVGEESTDEEWSSDFWSLPHMRISCEGERLHAQGGNSRETRLLFDVEPDDPAYVFFTSGTTGTPKGILGTHKGLSHFLAWEQHALGISAGDRVAQLTGLSFDVVLRDIFLPLTCGTTLCLPDSAFETNENGVVPWLLRERITILHAVPSLANAWLESLVSPLPLPNLRWVLFAGELLTGSFVQRWRQMVGTSGAIFNLYGPTETTLAKCAYQVPREVKPGLQPIGGPLPNSQALVINQADQLCGIDEPGEIVIRTPFRTLGYLGEFRDALAGFTPNQFRVDPLDLVYRTGDIGCYDSRGLLLISGRADDQVKIRGSRVEPAEISAALARHPDVRQSVVVAHEEKAGEKALIAYVVQEPNCSLRDLKELRGFLRRSLPDYMIPAFFVRLDKLPLTANGKLDRKALPPPEVAPLHASPENVAPRDSIEQILARLWRMLLRLDNVGIYEDFFELGGHSLTATRLVSHINREFEVKISLRTIFEHPTIESLAIKIAEKRAESFASEEVERILTDLESLPDEVTEGQILDGEGVGSGAPAADSPFHCPKTRSRFFGTRQCNLLIVINERFERHSFEELARCVHEFDPAVNPLVVADEASMKVSLPTQPTLIFSPAVIRHRPPIEGRFFCGYPLSKRQEYIALGKVGIPVPKWTVLSETESPDFSEFDDYLVKKPDYGGRGAEVKIVRKSRVKWRPVTTRSAGECSSFILQKFIYTGPRPVCYRVNTLFGRVLYSKRYEAQNDQPALRGPDDLEFSGRSIVASAKGSCVALNYDEEVIRLGERAHSAFPDIPLLGFDIIRELPSGNLFVLEANAIGYVWGFNGRVEESFGLSLAGQFDGLRKAAYILAEKTQQSAD